MTTDPPSFFSGGSAGYRSQLEQALVDHLQLVRDHAAGHQERHPWDFEAALVALRYIADELRRLTHEEDAVPF